MNPRLDLLRRAPVALALFASLASPACGLPDDEEGMAMSSATTGPSAPTAGPTPTDTGTATPPTPTPPPVMPPPPASVVDPAGTTPPPEPTLPAEPSMPPADGPPARCTTAGPSYSTIADIMDAKCTTSCHEPNGLLGGPGGPTMNAMLDLKAAAGYAELTTKKSLQVTDMWLVGTGLEDSYLWHKLQDTQATLPGGEMTLKMPYTGELTDAELALIEAWIAGTACP